MLKLFGLILLAVAFSACASIDGREQAVLVRSNPSGAAIIVNGEKVGNTPQYVELNRKKYASVDLESENAITTVPLTSHYRWRDSFFSNLILLYGAEIGWFLDLATGAAWDLSDPGIVELNDAVSPLKPLPSEKMSVAIAPPQAESPDLSDRAASALQHELEKSQDLSVQDYKVTMPTFLRFKYDFDSRTEDARRRDLYYALSVDKMYESTVETRDGFRYLKATGKDVITGESSAPLEVSLEADQRVGREWIFPTWLKRILPNDVGFDLLSDAINVTAGSQTYTLNQTKEDQWWATDLGYLSSINIASLPPRRMGRPGKWQLSLVPSFRVSRKRYSTGNLPGGQGQTFVRWWIGGGIGGEVGYQYHLHYVYFDYIPDAFWDEVTWSQDQSDHSATGTKLALTEEIGYVYFFDQNWNFRFFLRGQQEDPGVWADALQSSIPAFSSGVAIAVQAFTYGAELAYRFDIGI